MSSQTPPDPITTGFNPEAWEEPTGLLSKLRALVHYYVTYPIAQNYPITFSNLVFVTDATLTKMANTSYVIANLVPYLASLPPLSITWLALQNFTTIETDTVNPIGSTITIGSGVDHDIRIANQNSRSVILHLGDGDSATSGIHIGNGANSLGNVNILNGAGSTGTIFLGTRRIVPSVSTTTTTLNCPLTISYSPVFTSSQIGYIIPTTTFISNNLPSGGGSFSVRSVVLPSDGVWGLYSTLLGTGTVAPFPYPGTFYGIHYSTGTNGSGTQFSTQKTGQQIPPSNVIFSTNIFTVARLSGTIYLNGRSQTAYTLGSSELIVVRLA